MNSIRCRLIYYQNQLDFNGFNKINLCQKNISNGVKSLEVNKKIIVKKIKLVEKHLKRLKEF